MAVQETRYNENRIVWGPVTCPDGTPIDMGVIPLHNIRGLPTAVTRRLRPETDASMPRRLTVLPSLSGKNGDRVIIEPDCILLNGPVDISFPVARDGATRVRITSRPTGLLHRLLSRLPI